MLSLPERIRTCTWMAGLLSFLISPLPLPAQTPGTSPPAPPAGAALPGLNIGHPAPPLMIAQWYTGQPMEKFQPGQVYVIEFWATWCGPCLKGMPHLSQLQTQFGEKLHIIGVTTEDTEQVEQFLAGEQSPGHRWKDVITYRLAQDREGMMAQTYFRAAGLMGMPQAFIVGRDGIIEWIGRPSEMEEPLAQVINGTWDRAEAVAKLELARRLAELSLQLDASAKSRDWDAALSLLGTMQSLTEDQQQLRDILHKRHSILLRAGRKQDAVAQMSQLIDMAWNDAAELNSMAWDIATARGERDLSTALKLAERATELTLQQDASILDTLARIHFELGNPQQAIRWQTRAVELKPEDSNLKTTLHQYQRQSNPPSAAP